MANNVSIKPAKTLFTCRFASGESYILNIEDHNVNSYYLTNDKFKSLLDNTIAAGSIEDITLSKEEIYALLLLASNGLLEFTLNETKFSENMSFSHFKSAQENNDRFLTIAYKNNSPFSVKLEITALCNLKCKYCYMNGADNATIDCEQWVGILESLRELGVTQLEITGGEPLLYADLPIIIETADHLGFNTTIRTNGTLIDESFIDFIGDLRAVDIIISFHSMSTPVFEEFVQIKDTYSKVIGSINMLLDRGIPFSVFIVLTSMNENTIYDTINYLKSKGVRYTISPYIFPNMFSYGDNSDFRPSKEIIEKLTRDGYISRKRRSMCSALKSKLWISCNGDLFPCEMYRSLKVSNIFERDIREIWHSSMMDEFRNKLNLKEYNCNICKHNIYCNNCPALCEIFHK